MGISRQNFSYFVVIAYLYAVPSQEILLRMKLLPAQYAWIAVWNAVSTLVYIPQLCSVSAYPYATFPEARVTKAYIK